MSAFIPLSEFSDSNVMKKYGVKPDAETLDIVNTAAAQKEVTGLTILLNYFSPLNSVLSYITFKERSNYNININCA